MIGLLRLIAVLLFLILLVLAFGSDWILPATIGTGAGLIVLGALALGGALIVFLFLFVAKWEKKLWVRLAMDDPDNPSAPITAVGSLALVLVGAVSLWVWLFD